jgi:hypothetical protein
VAAAAENCLSFRTSYRSFANPRQSVLSRHLAATESVEFTDGCTDVLTAGATMGLRTRAGMRKGSFAKEIDLIPLYNLPKG